MQYMGGKGRIAKRVAQVILAHRGGRPHYLEPFLGGAFVFPLVAPHFAKALGSDVNPDLIELWKAARDGWVPPDTLSREQYQDLRHAGPSALRAFAGYGCSFGGKWFGGYATNARGDDFCGAAKRGVSRKAAGMRGARIELADYRRWAPGPDAVVYCDPPYAGTTGYDATDGWDAAEFWIIMEKWARGGAAVLVSEYAAPDGWRSVWDAPVLQSLKKDTNVRTAHEHLFVLGDSLAG
jgi:DNA adenine methylase